MQEGLGDRAVEVSLKVLEMEGGTADIRRQVWGLMMMMTMMMTTMVMMMTMMTMMMMMTMTMTMTMMRLSTPAHLHHQASSIIKKAFSTTQTHTCGATRASADPDDCLPHDLFAAFVSPSNNYEKTTKKVDKWSSSSLTDPRSHLSVRTLPHLCGARSARWTAMSQSMVSCVRCLTLMSGLSITPNRPAWSRTIYP
jgi:hypothetical protein